MRSIVELTGCRRLDLLRGDVFRLSSSQDLVPFTSGVADFLCRHA